MKEFFGNQINIDIEKVKIARIGDIVTTDNNQPIVATCDIKSCIAVLIICENEASLKLQMKKNMKKEKRQLKQCIKL